MGRRRPTSPARLGSLTRPSVDWSARRRSNLCSLEGKDILRGHAQPPPSVETDRYRWHRQQGINCRLQGRLGSPPAETSRMGPAPAQDHIAGTVPALLVTGITLGVLVRSQLGA